MEEGFLGTSDEGYVVVKWVRPHRVSRERFESEVAVRYRVPVVVQNLVRPGQPIVRLAVASVSLR
jgi:hypothetical protein